MNFLLNKIGIQEIDVAMDTDNVNRIEMEQRLERELLLAKDRITMQGMESSQMLLDAYFESSAKSGGPMGVPWYVSAFLVVVLMAILEKIAHFVISFAPM